MLSSCTKEPRALSGRDRRLALRLAFKNRLIASINEVLDRYAKLTADQAGAALEKRLAHEGHAPEATVTTLKKTLVERSQALVEPIRLEHTSTKIKRCPACISAWCPRLESSAVSASPPALLAKPSAQSCFGSGASMPIAETSCPSRHALLFQQSEASNGDSKRL